MPSSKLKSRPFADIAGFTVMAGRAGNAALSRVIALSLMLSLGFPLAGLAYQDTGFDQGRARMMTGDYDGAVAAFGESLGLNSNNSRALVLRGECFFKMGNYKLAIQDLTSALQYAPNNIRALILRGISHCSLGKDGMAILDFQSAIKLNGPLADKFFNRITGGGIAALERLEEQRKNDPSGAKEEDTYDVDDESGFNVHAIKDYREALISLKEGRNSTIAPDDSITAQPTGGSHGGNSAVGTSNIGSASASGDGSSGRRRHPDWHKNATAGTGASDNGDFGAQGATDYGETTVVSGEKDPGGKKSQIAKNLVGNPKEAADKGNRLPYIFQDAQNNADVDSDDTIARYKNERFTPNLDQDPMRGEFGLLSGAGGFPGDAKQAILDYSQAIKLDPTNAEYYYRRAKAFQKLRKVNDAMGDFNHAILQDPQQGKYYIGRASLYFQLGKQILMDADIVAARNCNPDLPAVIHFNLEKLPPGTQWAGDGARD